VYLNGREYSTFCDKIEMSRLKSGKEGKRLGLQINLIDIFSGLGVDGI
jgi:hypothetical protein